MEIIRGISGCMPRIAGHRFTVGNNVIRHERLDKSADEIAGDLEKETDGLLAEIIGGV